MAHVDQYGLEFTTTSPAAADAFVAGLDLSLRNHVGVRQQLHAALESDPEFALARALLAFHLQFDSDRAPAITQILVASRHATRTTGRERQFVVALRRALAGDTLTARRLIDHHLREFPRDAVMIREAVLLRSYGGASGRKASVAAALGRLAPSLRDDPWFLGIHSLALSEVGEVDQAAALANAALAAQPDHGVAAHALAHVEFERGDDTSARAFLTEWLRNHGDVALNAGHLTWHLTLAQLALADVDAAQAAYDPQSFSLEDSVSLLWRLQRRGVDVSRQWADLALEPPPPSPFRAFVLAHVGIAMAARRDVAGVRRLRDQTVAAAADHPQEPLALLVPLLDALALVAAERWVDALPAFELAAPGARRLGGSNEQLTLFDETLAFLRARAAGPPGRPLSDSDQRPPPRSSHAGRIRRADSPRR